MLSKNAFNSLLSMKSVEKKGNAVSEDRALIFVVKSLRKSRSGK